MLHGHHKPLFSTDPGKILDFSGRRPAEIFNEAILPVAQQFFNQAEDVVVPEKPSRQIVTESLNYDDSFNPTQLRRQKPAYN